MTALPGADLDRVARMTADLPGEIVDAAGIRERGLEQASDGERLAAAREAAPFSFGCFRGQPVLHGRAGRCGEARIACRVRVDDRPGAVGALGAKLGLI